MEKLRFKRALLFPLLAFVTVFIFAFGLGTIFTILNENVVKEWAVVAVGTAITVAVPTAAYLLDRRFGQP